MEKKYKTNVSLLGESKYTKYTKYTRAINFVRKRELVYFNEHI